MFDLSPFTIDMLVYILVFFGVLLAYEGLQQFLSRRETQTESSNRRMRMIKRGASPEDVLNLLCDPVMLGSEGKAGAYMRLHKLMVHAGFTVGPLWFFLSVGTLAGLSYLIVSRLVSLGPAVAISALVGVTVPFLVLIGLKSARIEKLTKQLPDALDLMSRGLKVGHPVAVTVRNVATNMPDPIGTEFGIITEQINFGDDVGTAFHDFAKRVGTEDANYLAVSIGISHGTGGNLARILNVLSQVIRDRQTMRKKIKAISAEGRLSGLILTLLPVIIYIVIEFSTPSFYGDVRGDEMFPYFAGAIVGLIVLQGLLLRRLVSFKF